MLRLLPVLFFHSATWPKGVQRMADQYMKDPVRVFVGSLDLNVSTLHMTDLALVFGFWTRAFFSQCLFSRGNSYKYM